MHIGRRILMSLLFAFGAQALPANATFVFTPTPAPFTFTPAAVGLTGAAVTADTILLSDFSNLTFTGATTFSNTGFLSITGRQVGGLNVTAGGLNSTYSLYFQFIGTGHLTTGTSNTDLRAAATAGVIDTLTYSLIGASGDATFGFNGLNPVVTPGGATQTLATGTLLNGNVMTTPVNGNTAFVPSSDAAVAFAVASGKQGFFSSPIPFYNTASITLTSAATTVQQFGSGRPGSGFIITGGGDLTIPEPVTLALIGLALSGLALTRRRKLN